MNTNIQNKNLVDSLAELDQIDELGAAAPRRNARRSGADARS